MTEQRDSQAGGSGQRKSVIRLNRNAQKAISIFAFALPLIYAYLSFKDLPVQDILKSMSAQSSASVMWKLVLALYYFAWVFGTRADAENQELVYSRVPGGGNFSPSAIGVIAVLFILAVILLWSPNFEFFVFALSAFFLFNIAAWIYLVRVIVRPSIADTVSASQAISDFVSVERAGVISRYLTGSWQWFRFLAGGLVIALLWALMIARQRNVVIPGIPDLVSWELAQVLGMALFAFVMEAWIWSQRLRTRISLQFLDEFEARYTMAPKQLSVRALDP
jgi:hypothetical protein